VGTEFVIVHTSGDEETIREWFDNAGHPQQNVTLCPMEPYISLTDWAEDAYVALTDERDGPVYLMEPWEFPRAGDALIAQAVQEYANVKALQAPLIFQGGNCLIGDEFWMLGRDYFADTVDLVQGPQSPVVTPDDPDRLEPFLRELFADYVDKTRELVLIGTPEPIGSRPLHGTLEGEDYFLDIADRGSGRFQPIFHIDMLMTLIGADTEGDYLVMVGSPKLGEQLMGVTFPYALQEAYDSIADDLIGRGMRVLRNPIVHQQEVTGQLTLAELVEIADSGNVELVNAIDDLVRAGATASTPINIRTWHHITWNNCLVENSEAVGRHVYLPTFGHGRNRRLAVVDQEMRTLWSGLGFEVHQLGDFNPFASRMGVVHCIKKYLRRGV
jgi:hypothetical protein